MFDVVPVLAWHTTEAQVLDLFMMRIAVASCAVDLVCRVYLQCKTTKTDEYKL